MKKFVSVLIALVIVFSFSVAGSAEDAVYGQNVNHISIGTLDKYRQQYVLGETILVDVNVLVQDVYIRYEKIVLYIDCNKDILTCEYREFFTENHTETPTGYRTEFNTEELWFGTISSFYSFVIKSKGEPAVTVRAEGITRDNCTEELAVFNNLPNNKVYEKDEIPVIETDFQPPVYGDVKRFSLANSGIIYLASTVTVEKVRGMLSGTDGKGRIVFIPHDGKDRNVVTGGDIFALEFEGKYCDFLQVQMFGDANTDGYINASDARLVLRVSAQIENVSTGNPLGFDVDFDNKTTAADARMILRVSAQLDYFRFKDISVWQNQPYKIGPLESASGGGYLWRCTVSEENAIEITEIIEPSVDNTGKPPEEIIVGAPAMQTYILKPLKQGEFDVHFELIRSWESEPIEEFGFTVVVDDIL